MEAEYFRLLFDYSYWARDRLLRAASGMTAEEYARPNGFTYGSIRGILTHAMRAEALYLTRWQGEQVSPVQIDQEAVPTVETLDSRWRSEEAKLRAFLEALDDADVKREIISVRRDGTDFRRPLWQDLTHVVNHSTVHRSEAAEALTMVGRSPGDLDFSTYLPTRGWR